MIFILALLMMVGLAGTIISLNEIDQDKNKHLFNLSEKQGTVAAVVSTTMLAVSLSLLIAYAIVGTEITTESSDAEITHELVQMRTEKGDSYLIQKGDKVQFCCYLDDGVIETYEVNIDDVSVSYDDSESPQVEYIKTDSTSHKQWWFVAGLDYATETEHDYHFVLPNRESISLEIER